MQGSSRSGATAEVLLKHGADPEMRNDLGQTPTAISWLYLPAAFDSATSIVSAIRPSIYL
jgi:hypothetical protein